MILVNMDTATLRSDADQVGRPLEPFEASAAWHRRYCRNYHLMMQADFEASVREGWKHSTLRNLVRRKGVKSATAHAATTDALRAVLLDYKLRGEAADARLRELSAPAPQPAPERPAPIEADAQPAPVEAPEAPAPAPVEPSQPVASGDHPELAAALEADSYGDVLRLVNAAIGGGAPRGKIDLYDLANQILTGAHA